MKMTSRFALVAAAGMLMAVAPAKAADLGGGCCADLEERVAELEATTARKGNRVVSLQVYGQVNKAIMFFDTDFGDGDAYVVDNDADGSKFGFTGTASVKPGVTAGYRMEIQVQDAASNLVDDGAAVGPGADFLGIPGIPTFEDASVNDDPGDEIAIRHNYVWIEGEQLGRVSLGHTSTATDGIAGINLANAISGPSVDRGSSMTVAQGFAFAFPFNFIGGNSLDLGDLTSDIDGPREDVIKYDSPSIYGFILSAAWGDDDFYDIALRFRKEWNSIRFAAGIGYQDGEDDGGGADFEKLSGSASVMHVPTGIYATFAAGEQEEDGADAGDYYFIQAGIEKRFFSYGSTTVYGEYAEYNDFAVGEARFNFGPIPLAIVTDSEVTRWGFGVVQSFDSAAMDIYAQADFYEADIDSATIFGPASESSEVSIFTVGTRIKF